MVSSSISQDARTKEKRLKANAERRAYRRLVDKSFADSERASNKKYRDFNREFNRQCKLFVLAHPQEFYAFMNGIPIVRPATPVEDALDNLQSRWGLGLA